MAPTSTKMRQPVTRSRKTFYAQQRHRLRTERSREEDLRLMYRLIPGKKNPERLAPRTFLHDGVLYRLKRSGDDFRVYANQIGDDSTLVVRGNVADLESAIRDLRKVHRTLSYRARVKHVPNPQKSTIQSADYSRPQTGPTQVSPIFIDTVIDHSTCEPQLGVEEEKETPARPVEEELDYLVEPVFGWVAPAFAVMGVTPMVVGFQRVDRYGNPLLNQRGYRSPDEDQSEEETTVSPRQPGRARKHVGIAAGIALSLASALVYHVINAGPRNPQEKSESYIQDLSDSRSGGMIHQSGSLPEQRQGTIYYENRRGVEERGQESLQQIRDSHGR